MLVLASQSASRKAMLEAAGVDFVAQAVPVQVKYFVMIVGAFSLWSAMGGPGSGVAHATHLGGLAVGYLYLKGRRVRLGAEVHYRLNRWRIDRMRKRFDVHKGGKSGSGGPRVH